MQVNEYQVLQLDGLTAVNSALNKQAETGWSLGSLVPLGGEVFALVLQRAKEPAAVTADNDDRTFFQAALSTNDFCAGLVQRLKAADLDLIRAIGVPKGMAQKGRLVARVAVADLRELTADAAQAVVSAAWQADAGIWVSDDQPLTAGVKLRVETACIGELAEFHLIWEA